MIVTRIERQKRYPERVNVYIDGEFAFGLHENVLVSYGLRKGDELTRNTFERIAHDEEFSRAKQSALRYLSYRMRSEKELRSKLAEKEFPPETIDTVIAQLASLGFVNDKEFARAFVKDIQLKKPAGRRLLVQKLRLSGVSPAVIDEVLGKEIDPDAQRSAALEAAKKLVNRYRKSKKIIERQKQEQHIAQFLARRGFDWSTIGPVLKQLFTSSSQG